MTFELREYQKECLEKIKETFKERSRQLIQLPTGGGKTWIFLNYLKECSKKSLIVCPTRELQEQIYFWGTKFNIKNLFMKKREKLKNADHYILTAASLNFESTRNYLYDQELDTIIIDEAHRAQADTYKCFLEGLKCNAKILGCTATPERLDKKPLLSIFDYLSYEKTIYELIIEGHLCDIEGYRIKTGCRIESNAMRAGDFLPIALKELDTDRRNEILLKTFMDNCCNKKTIIFCLSVEHLIKVNKLLLNEGIRSEGIYGSMGYEKRRDILDRFKRGETQVVCNCQLLTEGFDEPSIEAMIIARPTKSKSLYCQMIGRGVRKHPGKEICYLYELGDNIHNICSFNVAAGKDNDFDREYKPGIRLTELTREIRTLDIRDLVIETEVLNIFQKDLIKKKSKLPGNSINLLLSMFYDECATDYQRSLIEGKGISYVEPLRMLEADFLLWKEKKRLEYGFNK